MKFSHALMLIALALAGCSSEKASSSKESDAKPALPASQVKVEPVETIVGATTQVIAPGRIEANPGSTSKVALPMQGRIVQVMVTLGDSVQQGMPLLLLDSPDTDRAVADYREAVAKVAGAKSGQAKAEADLARAQDLLTHHAVAQKDVLNAQAQLNQSHSDLAQAMAEEEEATRRLHIFGIDPEGNHDRLPVRAPLSGKVLDLSVTAGEYRNDTSAPVMTIANLSTVYMTADVPETSIRFTKLGEKVLIKFDAYPDELFDGKVTRIGDTVDPTTRTIKVRALLNNAQGKFRPDMFGQLEIQGPPHPIVTIPVSSVVQTSSNPVVYRDMGEQKYDPVTVKLGDHIGNRVVVLQGLNANDRIVTDGAMLIRSTRQ